MKKKKRYASAPTLSAQHIEQTVEQVFTLAQTVASDCFYVVDVALEEELGRWYLRVYIENTDASQRISLEDCQTFSRALEPLVDEQVKTLTEFPYNFEISSPGLFRQLNSPRELAFYTGRQVELQIKGEKEPFEGRLVGYNAQTGEIQIDPVEGAPQESMTVVWDPKRVKITLSPNKKHWVELLDEQEPVGDSIS